MNKTIQINPVELRQHWTRRLLNKVDENSPQFLAMCDDILRGDSLPPIYIVAPNQVVAGWTRTLAHRKAQKDIECIVITEDESLMKSLKENALRLHLRKGQVAWLACPLADKVVEHSVVLRKHKLTGKAAPKVTDGMPENIEQLADQLGISRRLLMEVRTVYENIAAWDENHSARCWGESAEAMSAMEYWSQRIMDSEDPCTPGQAWAGIAGSDAGAAGKTNPEPRQLQLFTEGLASVRKWGKGYNDFVGAERKRAQEAIRRTVAEWPAELRSEFAAELKRAEREQLVEA